MLSNSVIDWHTAIIDLRFGELGPLMDWCKRNCSQKWYVSETEATRYDQDGNYKFYFESERDYINFLVWKK